MEIDLRDAAGGEGPVRLVRTQPIPPQLDSRTRVSERPFGVADPQENAGEAGAGKHTSTPQPQFEFQNNVLKGASVFMNVLVVSLISY